MGGSKVPNTISDKQMADLSRRAQKAAPPMFSRKAVAQRLNSNAQQAKADQS
jgi:hypothetical protein